MSLNELKPVAILAALVLALLFGQALFSWAGSTVTSLRATESLKPCKELSSDEEQVDCIFRSIDKTAERGDLKYAFTLFASAYRDFDSFSGSGCHRHAHRVGDSVYYRYYVLGHDDLEAIEFPQETTACGYGLFHGFLEHLMQDRPDPVFAMEVCETLDKKLSDTMKDIRVICYHGTGHGYTLANAESIPSSQWGDLQLFTELPLSQCKQMTRASESEQEDCRQGVFNVVVDWMEVKNYGFSYNTADPFELCNSLPQDTQYACYYEIAQKIGSIAENDPVALYEIAETASTKEFVDLSFIVGIAGVIQQTIVDGAGYERVLERCNTMSDEVFRICLEGTVWGLYEHGAPQEEYKKVLRLCQEPVVGERNETDFCYEKASDRLSRFYTNERIASICAEFPSAYASLCMKKSD